MKCPNGHENPDNAKFCNTCGAQISQEVICPNGHTNPPGSCFCNECGAAITGLETKTPQTPKANKKNILPIAMLFIVSVCLIYLLVSMFAYYETSRSNETSRSYPAATAKVRDVLGIFEERGEGGSESSAAHNARMKYHEIVCIYLVSFIIAEGIIILVMILTNKKKRATSSSIPYS